MDNFLADPEGIQREEEIAVTIMIAGLEDMTTHFLLRQKAWIRYGRTWCMLIQVRDERFYMEYQWWWDQERINLEGVRAAS